jgi:GT2 family glycosyltransferase
MTAVPEPPDAADAADETAPARLSVCIPAFNRPRELRELLDSIAAQDYPHFDVVISEDASPERAAIRAVVDAYQPALGGRIRYFENPENLGYDANFRQLIRRATGDFCFIMGNDDLVAPGALATVAGAIRRTPEAGVVLRSYAYFRDRPERSPRSPATTPTSCASRRGPTRWGCSTAAPRRCRGSSCAAPTRWRSRPTSTTGGCGTRCTSSPTCSCGARA